MVDVKQRKVQGQRARRGEAGERAFDQRFWREQGPEARFAAAWEMVSEVRLIRGEDGRQPRLQRSVQRIQRRPR